MATLLQKLHETQEATSHFNVKKYLNDKTRGSKLLAAKRSKNAEQLSSYKTPEWSSGSKQAGKSGEAPDSVKKIAPAPKRPSSAKKKPSTKPSKSSKPAKGSEYELLKVQSVPQAQLIDTLNPESPVREVGTGDRRMVDITDLFGSGSTRDATNPAQTGSQNKLHYFQSTCSRGNYRSLRDKMYPGSAYEPHKPPARYFDSIQPRRLFETNSKTDQASQNENQVFRSAIRASDAGVTPLRAKSRSLSRAERSCPKAIHESERPVHSQVLDDGSVINFKMVKPSVIAELIDDLEGQIRRRKEVKKGPRKSTKDPNFYVTESLSEEYAKKYLPPSRKGKGCFKMPIKMPTHMEYYEEDVLAETLKELIQIDKDLESRKNLLALKFDYNLSDLYVLFDPDNKGFVSFREFEAVFDLYKLYPSVEYLRLLFRTWDKDLDGQLSFDEFKDGILPKDESYKEIVLKRGSYNQGKPFSREMSFTPQTQRDLVALLKALTESENQLEKLREGLKLRRNFDLKDAFKSLDTKGKGYIKLENIRDFLTSRHIFCAEAEIQFLFDRMDKICCGQISENEFVKELRPKLL